MKNKIEKMCALCEKSSLLHGEDFYICRIKGIVEPGSSCGKFSFDPLKLKPRIIPPLPKFDESEFKI